MSIHTSPSVEKASETPVVRIIGDEEELKMIIYTDASQTSQGYSSPLHVRKQNGKIIMCPTNPSSSIDKGYCLTFSAEDDMTKKEVIYMISLLCECAVKFKDFRDNPNDPQIEDEDLTDKGKYRTLKLGTEAYNQLSSVFSDQGIETLQDNMRNLSNNIGYIKAIESIPAAYEKMVSKTIRDCIVGEGMDHNKVLEIFDSINEDNLEKGTLKVPSFEKEVSTTREDIDKLMSLLYYRDDTGVYRNRNNPVNEYSIRQTLISE